MQIEAYIVVYRCDWLAGRFLQRESWFIVVVIVLLLIDMLLILWLYRKRGWHRGKWLLHRGDGCMRGHALLLLMGSSLKARYCSRNGG